MKFDLPIRVTKLCYAACIVLCLAMQLYGNRCGLLLTPDSSNYISASQSFKTEGNFKSPDGSWYTYWPPLFPITLAVFDSPEQAARWMYVVGTILIGVVTILTLNQLIQKNLLKLLVLLLTLTSVQFMMISVFLWSEMNFILLVVCATYFALNLNRSKYDLIALTVFLFLMCLQRNAGVFIVSGTCCWILIDKQISLRKRILTSALVFILAISGLIAWNIYLSVIVDSGFYVYKHEFFIHAAENFAAVSAIVVRMFIPVQGTWTSLVGIVALLGLVTIIIKASQSIKLIGLLILFYWAGHVFMFRLNIDDMDRYLSPVIFLIYLLLFFGLEKAIQHVSKRTLILCTLLFVLWTMYPTYRTLANLVQWSNTSCALLLQKAGV